MKLYPEARHELLNELNRAQVTEDVIGWLDARVESLTPAPPTPQESEADGEAPADAPQSP